MKIIQFFGSLILLLISTLISQHVFAGPHALSNIQLSTEARGKVSLIRGVLEQGGFLIGQVSPKMNVMFLDKEVPVSDDGKFIIGFGRDFPAQATVTFKSDDKSFIESFNIRAREWNIERIDGLPPSKVTPRSQETIDRIIRESKLIREARAQVSTLQSFAQLFKQPATGRISGVYGSQRVLNGKPKRPHYGQDIAAPVGTPVYAPIDGKVSLAHNDMFYSGATLIIDHGQGLSTTYIHLNEIVVEEGQAVSQGQKIGTIGQSGRATGPHLDWRINWFDQRLDPALFLQVNAQ
ncbi:M23 family metallopeptidase [Pleionea sediminis]|uniref:M23 family metallopeptidase n=1 Tax=Pleionea sediminis TaxID=2569479 RepID=UPI001185232D|nr:M23 family metallopeptidase [Pleionea sediminis]